MTEGFRNSLASLRDALYEHLGIPATLHRLLESRPGLCRSLDEPPHVVSLDKVVKWHDWGTWGSSPLSGNRERGALTGWTYAAERYEHLHLPLDELVGLGTRNVIEDWECDIQDIAGLSASKSNLERFANLDAMVESDRPDLIETITEENLRRNLAHKEIRILHQTDPTDHFTTHLWDGRIFLVNSGGSRHLAAARYIAARLGTRVPLRGRLSIYGINQTAVTALRHRFDMFVVAGTWETFGELHKAMERFRATYLTRELPQPYTRRQVLFLPKSEPRAAKVASALRDAGFFDLGAYLQSLARGKPAAFGLPSESIASSSAF